MRDPQIKARRPSGLIASIALALIVVLSGCAETQLFATSTKRVQSADDGQVSYYKVGNAYEINDKWYYPAEDWEYDETGIASWYGPNFHGKQTANGEIFDQEQLTAAHRTLPMPSLVRVTNLKNGRSLVLRLNDRGPFAKNRIIDVSRKAAELLGFEREGTAPVRVQILRDQSLSMKRQLLGPQEIADQGSPITVAAIPKQTVGTSNLAPPPGASAAPRPETAPLPAPTQVASATVGPETIDPAYRPAETVQTEAVGPTDLFVQAGAFTNYQNALKTQVRLSTIGQSSISHVVVEGRDFYRVRVGPLATVSDADQMLSAVDGMGFTGAQIVVADASR